MTEKQLLLFIDIALLIIVTSYYAMLIMAGECLVLLISTAFILPFSLLYLNARRKYRRVSS